MLPQTQIVTEANIATFVCRSERQPKWFHEGEENFFDSSTLDVNSNEKYRFSRSSNGHSLSIIDIHTYDEGIYECLGQYKYGKEFFAAGYLHVKCS